jgi:hypothetical protein
MVFALAGDSTITSDFGNVAGSLGFQLKLTRIGPKRQTHDGRWLFALGFWLLASGHPKRHFRLSNPGRLSRGPRSQVLQAKTPAFFESWLILRKFAHVLQLAKNRSRGQVEDGNPIHLPIPLRYVQSARAPVWSAGRNLPPDSHLSTSKPFGVVRSGRRILLSGMLGSSDRAAGSVCATSPRHPNPDNSSSSPPDVFTIHN